MVNGVVHPTSVPIAELVLNLQPTGAPQTELLDTRKWRTRPELSTEIFDWIEVFYKPDAAAQRARDARPGRL